MSSYFSIVKQVYTEENGLFAGGDDNVNWQYCKENAAFSHKEVCEFILFCGQREYVENERERMHNFGCTAAFIEEYQKASDEGASLILFYQ